MGALPGPVTTMYLSMLSDEIPCSSRHSATHGIDWMKVGLLRPVTLWPFCADAVGELAEERRVKAFLTVEMNLGQMLEDVRLAVEGRKEIFFYGRTGGAVPDEDELFGKIAEACS